jgi:hypothetical protein
MGEILSLRALASLFRYRPSRRRRYTSPFIDNTTTMLSQRGQGEAARQPGAAFARSIAGEGAVFNSLR